MKGKRTCEDCTLCCSVLAVREASRVIKQSHTPCQHCDEGRGCRIYYAGRPQACILFECAYLRGEDAQDILPKELHVVPMIREFFLIGKMLWLVESKPGALDGSLVKAMIERYLARNMHVLLENFYSGRSILVPRGVEVSEDLRDLADTNGIKLIHAP